MRQQDDIVWGQLTKTEVQSGIFGCYYNIFQVLLVTFANVFFLWVCLTMHRKTYPHSPVYWLQIGCYASAILAVVAPLVWLRFGVRGGWGGGFGFGPVANRIVFMSPKDSLPYIGRSLHLSEAFVFIDLFLFFSGAPSMASASVPAAALAFDLLLLLPWVIRYKTNWQRQHR